MEHKIYFRQVLPQERELLWQLLQAELRELLPYYPQERDEQGQLPYPWFEAYFEEPQRRALLLQLGPETVGFAMINSTSCLGEEIDHSLAEFYICPAWRRKGLAKDAVEQFFLRWPGRWELKFHRDNEAARALWPQVCAPWQPRQRDWGEDVVLSFTVEGLHHRGSLPLETKRLLLRPFRAEDREAIFRNWASDPQVTQFLTWPTHRSSETTGAILAQWLEQSQKPDYYHWAMELKELGQPIGAISVGSLSERSRCAEVGYCLGKAWWGQGLGSEALCAVRDFLFEQVNILRLEARHDPRNPASGRVMEHCGLRLEGLRRLGDWNNQGPCDCLVYSLLRPDWEKLKH